MVQNSPFAGGKKPLVYLVSVPIGNMGDFSPRAKEILTAADIVACEDTRVTGQLLSLAGIKAKRLVSCYAQKELEEAERLVKEVKENNLVLAFCSDAGTPGISDPGSLLVQKALEAGVDVSAIPGPCAFATALVVSGFDTADFSFFGFLPVKEGQRSKFLDNLKEREETLIFYEAPHRVLASLSSMKEAFGGSRRVCLARELTKIHEEYTRGSLDEIVSDPSVLSPLGEYVIVVEGYVKAVKEMSEDEIVEKARELLKQGMRKTEAAKIISDECNVSKNAIYKLINNL
jgi:16S rRNA (cytidine1402-2'-O)-methyltransferase